MIRMFRKWHYEATLRSRSYYAALYLARIFLAALVLILVLPAFLLMGLSALAVVILSGGLLIGLMPTITEAYGDYIHSWSNLPEHFLKALDYDTWLHACADAFWASQRRDLP